jgi:hypothetical protein
MGAGRRGAELACDPGRDPASCRCLGFALLSRGERSDNRKTMAIAIHARSNPDGEEMQETTFCGGANNMQCFGSHWGPAMTGTPDLSDTPDTIDSTRPYESFLWLVDDDEDDYDDFEEEEDEDYSDDEDEESEEDDYESDDDEFMDDDDDENGNGEEEF